MSARFVDRAAKSRALAWRVLAWIGACLAASSCGRDWSFLDQERDANPGVGGAGAGRDGGAGGGAGAATAGGGAASSNPSAGEGGSHDAGSGAGGAVADDGGSGAGGAVGAAGAASGGAAGQGGPPEVVWSHEAGGPEGNDRVYDVAADVDGNVVLVGQIGNTTNFGCETHTVVGSADAFVVKYAPDGHCLWSKTFGAGADGARVFATGVATASNGDVVIGGFFDNAADFGGGPLLPQSSFDVYVAKFSAAGDHIWSRRYGSSVNEWAWDLALDDAAAVYVVGHYSGQSDLGTGPLPVFGQNDMFIAKFADADDASGGQTVWAQGYGAAGATTDSFASVAVGPQGEVVAAGYIEGSVDYNGLVASNVGGEDVVLTRHAPDDGHALWAKSYGGPVDDRAQAVKIADSRVFAGGFFAGEVDFDGFALASTDGSRDALLLELELADGAASFAARYGGAAEDAATSLDLNAQGRIALGGSFEGTISALSADFTAVDGQDAFVLMLDADHELRWAGHYGGGANDTFRALAWDTADTFVAGGTFAEAIDLTRPPLESKGDPDLFYARFRPPLEP